MTKFRCYCDWNGCLAGNTCDVLKVAAAVIWICNEDPPHAFNGLFRLVFPMKPLAVANNGACLK